LGRLPEERADKLTAASKSSGMTFAFRLHHFLLKLDSGK